MATTTGLVQRLTINAGGSACVSIGPSPTNVAALTIASDSSDSVATAVFKASMVDALSSAMVERREVTARHGDTDSTITAVELPPA